MVDGRLSMVDDLCAKILFPREESIVAKGDDIQERLIELAVRIVRLRAAMPSNAVGQHIGNQLLRSGTAPAAHYAEARGAESTKDFVHKLKLCLKELNETCIWLEILWRSELIAEHRLANIKDDCSALSRIVNASIQTATRNYRKR
jgi:four helix bundle protein